jgi:hypothetical protein
MEPNSEIALMTGKKAVWGARIGLAAFVLLTLLAAASCSEMTRTGQASSYLVITNLTGGPQNDATVESDVVSDTGSIFTDTGSASLQVQMKDVQLSPSANNAITLTQYRVEYIRSDGRNTQGVDVPYSFSSGLTTTIAGSGQANFTLVRTQAKEEAPLRALRGGGGANAISVIARVTFYGHDQTGREVSVTGNLDVTFADWAG